MKKNISLFCTKIIYLLFIIGTAISMCIVYKNVENTLAIRFVIGYVIFAFLFLFYIIFITFFNVSKLKWTEIKGRVVKFIVIFVVFGALNYFSDCIFRPSKVDLFREFSIPFGIAFGISFTDVIFLKEKENQKI